MLKFPHDLSYFYVQPASSVFIFPASSPACFTGAGLDTQGVRQITRPVLQRKKTKTKKKNPGESQESQAGTVQINTSVLWLPGKRQAWDLEGGGELGVGESARKGAEGSLGRVCVSGSHSERMVRGDCITDPHSSPLKAV